VPRIKAIDLPDLPEGQSWSDMIDIPLSRRQWNIVMSIAIAQLAKVLEAVEHCDADARAGDALAILVSPALRNTAHEVGDIVMAISSVAAPDLIDDAIIAILRTDTETVEK
jgi:hypothetical protein